MLGTMTGGTENKRYLGRVEDEKGHRWEVHTILGWSLVILRNACVTEGNCDWWMTSRLSLGSV